MRHNPGVAALAAAIGLVIAAPAATQPVSLQGKTVTIYISVGVGGGYDAYGRMVARVIGKHIPGNPTVVPTNMPGGGGHRLANYVYNVAPKDGTAIAIVQHTTVYDAAFGEKGVRHDSTKFNWLGSMAADTFIAFAWATTGVKSIEDAKQKQISVGATGRGATSFQYPTLLNNLFGTKLKVVTGYKGSKDIYHAIEQRELDAIGGLAWLSIRNGYPHWIKEKKINFFVQYGMQKHPELKDVPLIVDLGRNAEETRLLRWIFSGLQFARPFKAPPGVPKATVDMLRGAMMAAAKDPVLVAEAAKRKFDLNPVDGETVQKMVAEIYDAPQGLKDRARKLLTDK